jgi:hypothetical protein
MHETFRLFFFGELMTGIALLDVMSKSGSSQLRESEAGRTRLCFHSTYRRRRIKDHKLVLVTL